MYRVVIGVLFSLHGSMKVFGWPLGNTVPVGSWPYWWAGLIELVAGLLVAIGLFTRIAALLACGEMAVAYFWMHWPFASGSLGNFWPVGSGGNQGELAVLFCFGFLLIFFAGPGRFCAKAAAVEPFWANASATVVGIFRIAMGAMFALHGWIILYGWPTGGAPALFASWPVWWAGLIGLVTGLLIAMGLFTRVAAFLACGQMAVAYFWIHWLNADLRFWPFSATIGGNAGELAILYCFAFLLVLYIGPGRFALDWATSSVIEGKRGQPGPRCGGAHLTAGADPRPTRRLLGDRSFGA
jgi:putative oxidoreductase